MPLRTLLLAVKSPSSPLPRPLPICFFTHLLLALVAEAEASRPFLVSFPVVGASLVGLELHHPLLWGGGRETHPGGSCGMDEPSKGCRRLAVRRGAVGVSLTEGGGGPAIPGSLCLTRREGGETPLCGRYWLLALPPSARRLIPSLSSSHVGTAAATSSPATAANDDDRDAILGHTTPTAQKQQAEKGAGRPFLLQPPLRKLRKRGLGIARPFPRRTPVTERLPARALRPVTLSKTVSRIRGRGA